MARKPPGTNTRPTADWFAGNTASAGGLARAAAGVGVQVSLYNDAPQGEYLWVWWVSVFNDAEAPNRFDEFEGDQGTFLTQGVYVMAGRGAAYGHTSYDSVTAIADFPADSTAYASSGYAGDEAGTTTCFRSPGPVKVLPPGYSWACICEWAGGLGGALLAVWFYYTILPYIPQ